VNAPTLGEQLDQIMRELDATGAAWAAAGYRYAGPEFDAHEHVFARLREWQLQVDARKLWSGQP
jgi:hypothetical protein